MLKSLVLSGALALLLVGSRVHAAAQGILMRADPMMEPSAAAQLDMDMNEFTAMQFRNDASLVPNINIELSRDSMSRPVDFGLDRPDRGVDGALDRRDTFAPRPSGRLARARRSLMRRVRSGIDRLWRVGRVAGVLAGGERFTQIEGIVDRLRRLRRGARSAQRAGIVDRLKRGAPRFADRLGRDQRFDRAIDRFDRGDRFQRDHREERFQRGDTFADRFDRRDRFHRDSVREHRRFLDDSDMLQQFDGMGIDDGDVDLVDVDGEMDTAELDPRDFDLSLSGAVAPRRGDFAADFGPDMYEDERRSRRRRSRSRSRSRRERARRERERLAREQMPALDKPVATPAPAPVPVRRGPGSWTPWS